MSPDCSVLLITIDSNMDDRQIDAMHYGLGDYGVYDGGVARFYLERTFRAVVYRDLTGRTWQYGAINSEEAKTLQPC